LPLGETTVGREEKICHRQQVRLCRGGELKKKKINKITYLLSNMGMTKIKKRKSKKNGFHA
jgi:hypothetical protein